MSQTNLPVKNVETYTYYEEDTEEPLEVLLIGINSTQLGSDRTFQPPGFDRHHITTWLRKRYFFLNGTVYAQVPRRTTDFPKEARSQLEMTDTFATDVAFDPENNQLLVFYPVSTDQSLVLTWDIGLDNWSMKTADVPVSDGNIDSEHFTDLDSVWSSP